MRRANLVAGILCCAFGLAAMFWIIPAYSGESSGYGMSPQLLPTVAMAVVAALAAALVLQTVATSPAQPEVPPITAGNWATLGAASAIVLAGVLLVDFVGLWAGGPALMLALMLYMGERRWKPLLLTPLVMLAGVYLLMGRLLGMQLP